jgi:two-component system phosphate regulon response regulator PhoB
MTLQGEGYEVLVAEDGRQALELLQLAASAESEVPVPNLIILDLMLPYVSGLDICRSLRQQGNSTPILVISARTSETDIVVGLEVGADDYLPKPFGIKELVARCRTLLRRQSQYHPLPQQQAVLQFQEIVLHPQSCRVQVRGKEVNLSRKEFSLLELFMSNPRRVFSRDQLLEQVWGMDFMGESKTVDVHIRWLREKLEQDPGNPQYIITVRGFGYRLG